MSDDDHAYAVNPIVSDSVQHNARTLSNIRSLTSPLLGVAAGALCLESTNGFLFYLLGTMLVSLLIFFGPTQRKPERYFGASSAMRPSLHTAQVKQQSGDGTQERNWACFWEVATGGIGIDSIMGFVMAWTLLYNLVGT